VTAACLILESLLTEAPFFLDPQRLLWVFSGRRGMHCWIVERAREHAHIFAWEDSARRALVEYIYAQLFASLSSPSNNKNSLDQEGVGLIPSFFLPPACKKIIRSYFQWYLTEFPNCMQQEKIANFVFSQLDENASLRARVELFFRRHASEKTALELWSALEQEVLVNFTQGPRASHCVAAQFVGSRLDRDITARREHCIKLMFCVHPDTGNICTAVPRDQLEHFFPDETSVPQYTNLHHSPASLNQYNQSIEAFRNILLPPSPPSPTVASL
jgi:DNA primase small subunit